MSTMDLAEAVATKDFSIEQVLRVKIQDAQCVIDLSLVERVISIVALKPVPGAPPHLVGLLDYHGESIPIVDLGWWLGQTDESFYTLDTPMVLCSNGQHKVGFIVEQVLQVETVSGTTHQMVSTFEEASSPFIAALKLESGLSLLLDMPRILTLNFSSASSCLSAQVQLPKLLESL